MCVKTVIDIEKRFTYFPGLQKRLSISDARGLLKDTHKFGQTESSKFCHCIIALVDFCDKKCSSMPAFDGQLRENSVKVR